MSPVECHTKMRNVIKIQQVWSRPWVQVTLVSKAAGAEWKTLSDKAAAGFVAGFVIPRAANSRAEVKKPFVDTAAELKAALLRGKPILLHCCTCR